MPGVRVTPGAPISQILTRLRFHLRRSCGGNPPRRWQTSRDRSALAVRDLSVNPRRKRTTAPNYDPTKPRFLRYRLGGFGASHARDCPHNPTVRGRIRLLRRGENHRVALMPCRRATLKDCRVALRRALPNLPDHLYREHPRRQAAASSTGNRHRETWAREGTSLGEMLALRVRVAAP